VQGVRDQYGLGAIQNLGVAREHRCCGLGRGLLMRSLAGFRHAGVRRAYLEVTAENAPAIRLYRRAGFSIVRTVYKTVEAAYST
jgi:ribosomal protein S18 acetylase RimI-like enzyme